MRAKVRKTKRGGIGASDLPARRIGLISDTHGLLRPEAIRFLDGSDHIIHAGDIGKPDILGLLAALAPVTAVRGNNDSGGWARSIPSSARLTIGKVRILVVHDLKELDQPVLEDVDVIVSGHSHKPRVEERDGVLYVNPGSAGPRRFTLPVAVAELEISGASVRARVRELL